MRPPLPFPMLLWVVTGLAWLPGQAGLGAVETPAQPTTSRASGGSILRLVSGVEGKVPSETPSEVLPTPSPDAGGFEVPSVIEGRPLWTSPYHIGAEPSAPPDLGWTNWLPGGMVPIWGVRTPQEFRYTGRGDPLIGSSWLNRPYHVDLFAGSFDGDEVIRGKAKIGTGFFGGYRLGWDYDYYWGLETRIGASTLGLTNLDSRSNVKLGTIDVVPWDVDLLYYPWGDARWRPYAIVGAGLTHLSFDDERGRTYHEPLFTMPIGFGIKVRCLRDWLALRLEMLDNLAIGSAGLDTMHNITLTGGIECHFGGPRKSYWPWNPDRYLW